MTDASPRNHGLATPGRAHWTPAKQRIFLVALLETGSVARAARAAGMSRSSAHRLRQHLAGTPFDRDWHRAVSQHARQLADPFASDPAPAGLPHGAERGGARGAARARP